MPLVATALTFGSFGDILEAAKIAKRIIDVLLSMSCIGEALTVLLDAHLTTRLRDEVGKPNHMRAFSAGYGWLHFYNCTMWENNWDGLDLRFNMLDPGSIMLKHTSKTKLEPWGCSYRLSLRRLIETHLSAATSRMGSEIHGVATDIQTVEQAIHKILPRNISDPFFYVRSPLGQRIPIPLSAYHIFDECHHCGHTNADAVQATWVNWMKYQVSKGIEDIYSPQTFRPRREEPDREEGQAELFRLVQIFYRRKRGARKGKGASQSPLSPKDETLENVAAASQALAREISRAAGQARRPSSLT
ncbi:hypothetical protein DFH08DRAFT_937488 [Mycena albidolilacea]|uniref:Uncharacterized protein n=1 Tax=Mycena albidolilacea TaxID=1033008 RepID=A0AAD7A022_9AGAR|nr:hypothetical protein DFH08DRAFT_937488 [Mycena albidolilacea]